MGFEWVGRIGAGAFGEVWRAFCREQGQEYAVKFLKEPYAAAILRRFEREGGALTSLRHPNIVSCFGFVQFENRRGLIMEYLSGGTLRDSLRRGRLPVSNSLAIMHGVLSGLQHAHSADFVHRDIKPDNVLFDSKGNPKIGDFGLVKLLSQAGDGLTIGAVGTPGYIAPELIDDPKAITSKADMFSAGVTLYELLTGGMLQFEGQRIIAPSRFNPGVGEHLDKVVLRMVDLNPKKRPDAHQLIPELAAMWRLQYDWELEQQAKARAMQAEAVKQFMGMAACVLVVVGLILLLPRLQAK
jgi:serine/threonine protein kinase